MTTTTQRLTDKHHFKFVGGGPPDLELVTFRFMVACKIQDVSVSIKFHKLGLCFRVPTIMDIVYTYIHICTWVYIVVPLLMETSLKPQSLKP